MKPLAWDLVQLLRRNRDGSRATQYARKKIVMRFAQSVQAAGARNKRLSNLKHQDFARAIQGWRKENLSDSTLRNRVAALRWVAEKIGKPQLVAKDNEALGLRPRRDRVWRDLQAPPDKIKYFEVLDPDGDPVRLVLVIRDVGRCALLIDRDKWGPIRFLELLDTKREAIH